MIITPKMLGTEGYFLSLKKSIYKTPKVHIPLKVERQYFPIKIRNKTKYPFSSLLLNVVTMQEGKKNNIQTEWK